MLVRLGFSASIAAAIWIAATFPATAATPTDACMVLTAAQVSSAVGVKVGAGGHVTPTFTKTCTWTASGVIVTLNIQTLDMFNAAKNGPLAGMEVTPAAGVGNDAFYMGVGSTVSLLVKKGSGAFKVAVYSSKLPLDQRKTVEKALAQQAASKF